MDRKELLLAMLASSDGRPYSPVQLQKAIFLVSQNLSELIDQGPSFKFVPYDYGPFDSSIYVEAQALQASGMVVIAPSGVGRWNTYAVSDTGLERGREILGQFDKPKQEYFRKISTWVRSQSFSGLVKSIYEAYPKMKINSVFVE